MTPPSVVIPTYNGSTYLRATLACLAEQTLRPAEVLVVDDCSKDDTATLAEQCGRELGLPLRVIRLPKNSGGPATPMNVGVEQATAPFVALCDQDDLLPPDRLARQVSALAESPSAGLSCGAYVVVDHEGEPVGRPNRSVDGWLRVPHRVANQELRIIDGRRAYLFLLQTGFSIGGASSICFNKGLWQRIGGFDSQYRICWDYDFAIRAASASDLAYDATPISYHRMHTGNLSRHDELQAAEQFQIQLKHYLQPEHPIEEGERRLALAKLSAELAYRFRTQGKYYESARAYLRQFAYGQPRSAIAGLTKLAVFSLYHRSARRNPNRFAS